MRPLHVARKMRGRGSKALDAMCFAFGLALAALLMPACAHVATTDAPQVQTCTPKGLPDGGLVVSCVVK